MDRDDFEAGEFMEVERKPHAGAVVSVRLSSDELRVLQQTAEVQGITVSAIVRHALSAFVRGGLSSLLPAPSWTGTTSSGGTVEWLIKDPAAGRSTGPVVEPMPVGSGVRRS